MKPVRLLLIVLGILALLGAVAVALVLTPAVQRWAVLRAAGGQPGLHLQVNTVAAGPASLAVRGLHFEQDGLKVDCDRLDADFSLIPLLFGTRLELGRVDIAGLTVDASGISRHKAMAAIVAAPAALVRIRLPLELVIGDLKVEGRALLAGAAGRPKVQAEFSLTGGHIAPRREGALRLKARLVDPQPGARVGALELQIGLKLKQSSDRSFDRIGLTAVIDAAGPQITGQNQLKVAADLGRTLSGESYLLHVDTLNNGRAQDILVVTARQPLASKSFAGDWTLTAQSAQVEPFIIGGALPKFDARGSGTFVLNGVGRVLALQGSLHVLASGLEALRPALRAVGAVKLDSGFDVAVDSGGVQLNKLDLTVAGEKPVLEIHASDAAAYNLKERRLQFGAPRPGAAAGSPGEILRLKLAGLPLAWVRPFLPLADVSGGAATGEFALDSRDGRRLVARTVSPLVVDGITVVRRGRTLLANADLTLGVEAELVPAGAQFRIASLVLRTPAGDVLKGQATVTTPLGPGGPVAVSGEFSADLPELLAPWLPVGHLRAQGAADCTLAGDRAEFRRLDFEATDEKGQRLAAIALTRPFGLDLVRLQADTGTDPVELARLNLGRLPLGLLIRPRAGLTFNGSISPDEFVLRGQGDRLSLAAAAPLLLSDVIVDRHRQRWLDQVTLEFSPVLEFSAGQVSRAASGDVLMRDSSGASLAKFNAEMTTTAATGPRATLSFNLDLPALEAQPRFARAEALSAGQASGEIRTAELEAGAIQFEARATLNGLVARESAHALPVANLSVRCLTQSDGRFSLEAPILLDSAGERSDLNISADGSCENGSVTVDAHLTGGHVDLADLLLLSTAAGEPMGSGGPDSSAAEIRALSPPAADESPFWRGISGQMSLDCKEVVDGKDWTMSALTGRLALEPERIELQKLAAEINGEGRLTARGTLAFADGLDPYRLTGEIALTKFDPGRFFKAVEPDRAPTIEGLCDLSGGLEGQGLTLDDTLARTRGQFEFSSTKGVFRGLRRASEKLSLASKAVAWSAALGSLLRTGKVKEAAEKVAGSGYYVDQLAQTLAEITYDRLSFKLVREQALDLTVKDVSLIAQEVRLSGGGQVTYSAGRSLLEQPLSLSFALASRGRIEQIFGKLHLLDGTRDELDYARVKNPVVLGGTLGRPDPVPYYVGLLTVKASE